MIREILAALALGATCVAIPSALAGDEMQCMDCHEPAEDWEGMSVEEVFTMARKADNKRHRDNDALSDEELRALIVTLLGKSGES